MSFLADEAGGFRQYSVRGSMGLIRYRLVVRSQRASNVLVAPFNPSRPAFPHVGLGGLSEIHCSSRRGGIYRAGWLLAVDRLPLP